MTKAEQYRKTYPNKTDEQIIESLAWELSDKVETIGKLLAENKRLSNPEFYCFREDFHGDKKCQNQCQQCLEEKMPNNKSC